MPRLAPHLPDTLLQDALTAVQGIEDEWDRVQALTGLAPHLPDRLLQDALTEVQGNKRRAKVLTGLAPHLPDFLRESVLQDALIAAKGIEYEMARAEALTGLAPHLPDALLQDALAAVQAIKNGQARAAALTALVQRLIELPSAELLSLWYDLLERLAQRSRPNLLSDLRVLTPVIAKLGEDEAIIELFHAIQDVGRWWP